jgi:cyanate lyase
MTEKNTARETGRINAVLACAAIMIDKKRPDIARDIFKAMNIDAKRLAELKQASLKIHG